MVACTLAILVMLAGGAAAIIVAISQATDKISTVIDYQADRIINAIERK